VSELERLDEQYREHHRERRASGQFVFGGDERGRVFASLVGGPGRRVLDLGCRAGALTRFYVEGNDVVGVDVDSVALARAAELGIETVHADVEEPFPFPAESFDVVVAGELLEHLRSPERVVAEARRVLRPGGIFVGSVPNFFRLRNRLAFLAGRPLDHDPTHLRIFAPRDVRTLMDGWSELELHFVASRFLKLSPTLFGHSIVFSARTPPRT
jgi:SAM-dependent methyltransferase